MSEEKLDPTYLDNKTRYPDLKEAVIEAYTQHCVEACFGD